ncbi:MAG: hypothetical protein WCK51_09345 [Armatimonadota bacterium]
MKGMRVGILVALLLCLPILLARATSPGLLNDSDTKFLLMKLGEYNNPLRWFTHDWPLENHFYRPISTLVFELDWRLHPGDAAAFGLTNAILCCFCALGVFWLAWELTQSIPKAIATQALFVWWTLGRVLPFLEFVAPVVLGLILIRFFTERRFRWDQVLVAFSALFITSLLVEIDSKFSSDTLRWLPGRTATTMTVFCLVALASYIRFERLGATRNAEPAPSSTDVPATRSSVQRGFEPHGAWGWFGLSIASAVLAMGSYEQAVMFPFVVFGLGFWLRTQGVQARFALQTMFWLVLFGYIMVRVQFIPIRPSGYQSQQFRSGPGVLMSVADYVLPGALSFHNVWISLSSGLLILLTPGIWLSAANGLANLAFWARLKAAGKPLMILVGCAAVAYLPMAFLHQFGHYHYWPGAFMALFAVLACEQFWKVLVTAVSPQALQAPPRSSRAPGSLPHL